MAAMSNDPLLVIEDLRVDIQTPAGALHAVRGVDLSVGHGETLCLVGESGCGKSLTALALMDLLPAKARRTARRIRFAGADLETAARCGHSLAGAVVQHRGAIIPRSAMPADCRAPGKQARGGS